MSDGCKVHYWTWRNVENAYCQNCGATKFEPCAHLFEERFEHTYDRHTDIEVKRVFRVCKRCGAEVNGGSSGQQYLV